MIKRSWNIGPLALTAAVGVSGICLFLGTGSDKKTKDERFREAVAIMEECDLGGSPDDPPLLAVSDADGRDLYARYRCYVPRVVRRGGHADRLLCGNCDSVLTAETKYCPECGTKIAPFTADYAPGKPEIEPAPPTPD